LLLSLLSFDRFVACCCRCSCCCSVRVCVFVCVCGPSHHSRGSWPPLTHPHARARTQLQLNANHQLAACHSLTHSLTLPLHHSGRGYRVSPSSTPSFLLRSLCCCRCCCRRCCCCRCRCCFHSHQPLTSHSPTHSHTATSHRARANNANHHSLHSAFALADCALRSQRALCVCLPVSLSHSYTHSTPHTTRAHFAHTQTRSWLTATHTDSHSITLFSRSACVSRALSSLLALFSLLPGHTDRLERRAHTHHPCVARGAASVTRSSRSLSMNRSRSWLSSVRNLALSRSARLAARNHAHTAQTGVRVIAS
jgi:hypothetical protein